MMIEMKGVDLGLLPSLSKKGMATVRESAEYFKRLVVGFEPMLQKVMNDSKGDVVDFVQEQLYSGVNGRDKSLRPTYLNDPWFNTKEAGRWYKNAKSYMKWKMKGTPPLPSYLGYGPRDAKTPNLIIRGDFYDSITAIPMAGGLRIETRGTSFGADVERKYGSVILGVGDKGKDYFVEYVLKPELIRYFGG